MAPEKPWTVRVRPHPGSSRQDIDNEPDWTGLHNHRVGFKNRGDRRPGITHAQDEYLREIEEARKEQEKLRDENKTGKLVNFRDVIMTQEVSHSIAVRNLIQK